MISSFISVVILMGVLQLTLAINSSYLFQNQVAQIQENVRYTINELSTQIKNSHIFPLGCDENSKIANLLWNESILQSPVNNMGLGLNVIKAEKNTKYAYRNLEKAFEGSDILYVGLLNYEKKYTSNQYIKNANKWILDDDYERPKEGVMLLMDDNCDQTSVFMADFYNSNNILNINKINEIAIKQKSNKNINTQNCSYYTFGDFYCLSADASQINGYQQSSVDISHVNLYPIKQNYYYVANSTQKDKTGNYYPALYRNSEELVQGVEKINILLGVDYNNDNVLDQYVKIEKLNRKQWVDVKIIRIEISMRSLERVKLVNGLDNDRYIRKNFTQTIYLRN